MAPSLSALSPRRSPAARWLVPAGTAGVVAVAVLVGSGGTAGADPVLPDKSAADLLAAVSTAQVPGLSGTVETSADLGLPSLGALTGGGSSSGPTGLTSGQHELRVWTAGTDRSKVEIDDQMSGYSLLRRGQEVYAYDSAKNTVTEKTLPAHQDASPLTATTPADAAKAALAAVDPSTEVTVDRTASVAGRDAYQLVLTPKDARSLVGSVRLAIDSATSIPLRVQVFSRGNSQEAAVSVGYSTVDLSVPDDSVFTVPTGQPVSPPAQEAPSTTPEPTGVTHTGTAWTEVVSATGVTLPAQAASMLTPATTSVNISGVAGRLLKTKLVSALLMDDGRAYVGAVTPETLTAAATK
jgi:outer membrane lipoprotein-sorting protein